MAARLHDKYELSSEGPNICLWLKGNWRFSDGIPPATSLTEQIAKQPNYHRRTFRSEQLDEWDSGLMTFLVRLIENCRQQQISVDQSGLPQGVQKLLSFDKG